MRTFNESQFPPQSEDENKFPTILKHSKQQTKRRKTWRKENLFFSFFSVIFCSCNIKGKNFFFSAFSQDFSSLLHIFLTLSFATFHLALVLSDASKETIWHMVKKSHFKGLLVQLISHEIFSKLKINSENGNRKFAFCEKVSSTPLRVPLQNTTKSRRPFILSWE